MSEAIAFEALKRETTGTGAARELRRNGRIPAVVYGNGETPFHVSLPAKEVALRTAKKSFKSTVFELNIGGKKIKVIAKDVQFHPVTDIVEHLDFQLVSDKTAVKATVAVVYTNTAKAPGLKRGGVLNVVAREIEFYCPSSKIPTQIEVDLTGLEIGHAIHINDVKLPDGVRAVDKRNVTLITIVGKGSDEPAAGAADAAAAATPAAGAAAPAAGAAAKPGAAPAKAGAAPAAAKPAAKPAAKK